MSKIWWMAIVAGALSIAFVMSSDVVVVVMLAVAITLARPMVDPAATFSTEAFRELGHEILGSVAMSQYPARK